MGIVISGTTNDITINGASVATDTEVTSAVASGVATKANTTDVNTQLAIKSNINSPAFTGVPTAPTATAGTNTTQIATTAFVLANANAVNATTVANATAGIAAGAVGSYAFLSRPNTAGGNPGTTWAGSSLYYMTGGSPSGTWRSMGGIVNSASSYEAITLFLRIA